MGDPLPLHWGDGDPLHWRIVHPRAEVFQSEIMVRAGGDYYLKLTFVLMKKVLYFIHNKLTFSGFFYS